MLDKGTRPPSPSLTTSNKMSRREMIEVAEFLRRGIDKSTFSQIIIPFCSDTTGERAPVALLSGNINLKASLKRDNRPVVLEEELERLEDEISSKNLVKGQVVDLSNEIKRLQIETSPNDVDIKEVEIKEEWTLEDEAMILFRRSRVVGHSAVKKELPEESFKSTKKSLEDDIEEMLRVAEMEEEAEAGESKSVSKVEEIKREVKFANFIKTKSAQGKELPKGKLPKINSSNPLVGDVIERTSEPFKKPVNGQNDQVSSRIILNELKKLDLRAAANEYEGDDGEELEEEDEKEISTVGACEAPLKKSSLFSLRKQQ